MSRFKRTPLLLWFLLCAYSWAQYDAMRWPVFPYDPNAAWQQGQPSIRKPVGIARLYPTKYPPEAATFHSTILSTLTQDGIPWINVSPYQYDQSETWIAYNPANPQNLIVGANDGRGMSFGGPYNMYAFYSTDGGYTWKQAKLPTVEDEFIEVPGHATNFDPCIAFNSEGWAFYSFGFTQIASQQGQFEDNGIFVCRSTDGGASWEFVEPVSLNIGGGPFEDKYLMTIDAYPNSPYRDNIYITWTRFGSNSGIYFVRSTDNGNSWSVPKKLNSGGSFQSPVPVVGPNGRLYVFWRSQTSLGQTHALVRTSTDGGLTWGTIRIAQTVYTTGKRHSQSNRYVLPDKQNLRVSSYPAAAVDFSTKFYGRVYVVQSGKQEFDGPEGIFLTYSDDGGKTWASPVRVDNNTIGTDVFFPAIAVDPKTGIVGVLYYSSENDPNNKGVDAILALSDDGGKTFRHIRLTPYTAYLDDPNDVSFQGQAGNYYWGDYTSITARDGVFYPCYWFPDPNADYNYYSLDVYTNIVSLAPKPVSNLTATPSITVPSQILLQWEDPVENIIGAPLDTFTIHISRYDGNTQELLPLATLPPGVEQYLDTTAIDGHSYSYNVWVTTPDGFQSAVTSVDVTAGGALQPFPPTDVVAKPHTDGVLLQWVNPAYHIDSTEFYDFYQIRVYGYDPTNDSTWLLESFDAPQLQWSAGTPASVVLNLPLEHFYWFRLTAVGKRGNTLTESWFSPTVFSYAGAPLTQFAENFDGPSITPYYTNGKWGITSVKALSPPNCITDSPDGNYSRREKSSLIFAPFIVTPPNTTLSFAHISLIHPAGDVGMVYVSNDFGKSWIPLMGTNRDRAPDLFDSTIAEAQWLEEHRDLSAFVGDTLYLKFLLLTNAIRHDDGWYIDDIRIDDATTVKAAPKIIVAATLSPNPASDHVLLSFHSLAAAATTVVIRDLLGRQVLQQSLGLLAPGFHRVPLHLEQLSTGSYYLQIYSGNAVYTLPLIITR